MANPVVTERPAQFLGSNFCGLELLENSSRLARLLGNHRNDAETILISHCGGADASTGELLISPTVVLNEATRF